ncbi:MAG: aminotransferase class I/II-fold pyridoxal phosphate-dependent enzyme, partial [Planctomycetota bacterium]
MFGDAGFEVKKYTYYNAEDRNLNFDGMRASMQQIPAGDIIILHACCHNPSGIDPTLDQWKQIAQMINDKKLLPLMDFAYQGLGRGLDQDAEGLRAVAAAV